MTLIQASLVSKDWLSLARDNQIWKELFERRGWKIRKDAKGLLKSLKAEKGSRRVIRNSADRRLEEQQLVGQGGGDNQPSTSTLNDYNYLQLYSKRYVLEKRWRGIDQPLGGIQSGVDSDQTPKIKSEVRKSKKNKNSNSDSDSGESSAESSSELSDSEDEIPSDASEPNFNSPRKPFKYSKCRPQSTFLTGHTDSVYCLRHDQGLYSETPIQYYPTSKTSTSTTIPKFTHTISAPKIVSGSRDHLIKIWDSLTQECRFTLKGHGASVLCLEYDDEILISGGSDKVVLVWDFSDFGRRGRRFERPGWWNERVAAQESGLELKGERRKCDSGIGLNQRGNTGIEARKTPLRRSTRFLEESSVVKDVNMMDCQEESELSSEEDLEDEEIEQPKILTKLKHHREGVLDLAFNSDYIISCSKDFTVCVWSRNRTSADPNSSNSSITPSSSTSFQPITLNFVYSSHSSPVNAISLYDSQVVSASGDNKIYLWSVEEGATIREFQSHKRGLACLDFKSKEIVSGSNDLTIKIWNKDTGDCKGTMKGHEKLVRAVVFDEKRRLIVSGGYDRRVLVWDVSSVDKSQDQVELEEQRNMEKSDGNSRAGRSRSREVENSPEDGIIIYKPMLKLKSKALRVFDVHFDIRKIICGGEDWKLEIKDFTWGLGDDCRLFEN